MSPYSVLLQVGFT